MPELVLGGCESLGGARALSLELLLLLGDESDGRVARLSARWSSASGSAAAR